MRTNARRTPLLRVHYVSEKKHYFGDDTSTYFEIVNSLALMLVIFFPLGAISLFAGRVFATFFVKLCFVVMIISVGGGKCGPSRLTKTAWRHKLSY